MAVVRMPPASGRSERGRPSSHANGPRSTYLHPTAPVQSGKGGKGGKVGGKGGKGEGIVGGSLRASGASPPTQLPFLRLPTNDCASL